MLVLDTLKAQLSIPISKNWTYQSVNDESWLKCQIPNSIYTILEQSNIIQSPFLGNAEAKLDWISKKTWVFKNTFDLNLQDIQHEHIEIQFKDLDTYAEVYLNDSLIGKTNNAFRIWTFDIKNIVKPIQNELKIVFQSAPVIADSLYRNLDAALPGDIRVTSRKPQYHFGWDFGPKYPGCGIMSTPTIQFWNHIKLEDIAIQTRAIHHQNADVDLCLTGISDREETYQVEWTLDQLSFSQKINIPAGSFYIKLKHQIPNPKLWWPNGSGESYLYALKVQIKNQQKNILTHKENSTGIRTIKLISKKDKWGQSFYFQVNGKPIFIKGSNYIPQDIFQNRNQDHTRLLNDIKECHFNMIRIWGGGNYESDTFYSTCDRLGIMVWQDFMYACAMYPGDALFIENIKIEAEEQVRRLSKYPCLALWCGNNENNEAWHRWGWQTGLSHQTKTTLWEHYQKIFNQVLPNIVTTYSNHQSYWESSPLFGRGDKRFKHEGDAHDWGVWHDEMPFESFEQRIPRFMSEMGFQSLPNIHTIHTFVESGELSLENPSILSHQKHPRGNQLIQKYLERDLPKPKTFEDLIYLNQINQAEGIGLAIKAHRRAKPYCMGTLYWQLNDCWPGISWSGIDYYGHWKAMQHKVKELYQPVIMTTRESGDLVEVFITSDLLFPNTSQIEISHIDFMGKFLTKDTFSVNLKTNQSKRIFTFDKRQIQAPNNEFNSLLSMRWIYNKTTGQAVHFFAKLKELKLTKPDYQIKLSNSKDDVFKFTITSNTFCKSVYFDLGPSVDFFPNFVDLLPNQEQEITVKTELKKITLEQMTIKSLYDFLEINP